MITQVTLEIDPQFEPMIDPYVTALKQNTDVPVKRKKNALVFDFSEAPTEPADLEGWMGEFASIINEVDEEYTAE